MHTLPHYANAESLKTKRVLDYPPSTQSPATPTIQKTTATTAAASADSDVVSLLTYFASYSGVACGSQRSLHCMARGKKKNQTYRA